MTLRLERPPLTKDELFHLVQGLWGVTLPRVPHCEGHTAPFDAFSEAFFGNKTNYVLWYGSRGTGKSFMLALLALTKALALDIDVTLLGGSLAQSQNVHEHVENLLKYPNAPLYAIERVIKTEIEFVARNWIRPLPASQKTVRGPHPQMTLLDEIDEMEYEIYTAALPQAMAKPNARGHVVPEMTVASSTWQNPSGTFKTVFTDAQRNNLPVRTWCWRDVISTRENPTGWMDPDFIERKRASVPAELFRVEYDLGEPSGVSRAFDLTALNRCLVDVEPVHIVSKDDDELIIYEEPVKWGTYATGADWAKEKDFTVIVTWRIDQVPCRLAHIRIMRRRPWPDMISYFNETTKKYVGMSAHDATGIGNVVGDMIDERTIKMVMVGRDRTTMLTDYITAVENQNYAIPVTAKRLLEAHRSTTVDDVYRTASVRDSHLPDEVAASALAHRAATRGGWTAIGEGAKKVENDPTMPVWLQGIDHIKPPPARQEIAGQVVEMPEQDDVGVFWLS